MRQLSLNEKISIKGKLARQGVLPHLLVNLDTREAVRLHWVCFGTPVAMHSTPTMWRRPVRRRAAKSLH